MFSRYLQLCQAMVHFAAGRWGRVVGSAAYAAEGSPPIRSAALTLIARLAARRGDPAAHDLLAEAWPLALATGEPQRIGPTAAAIAEAAVLAGDPERARDPVRTAATLAQQHGTPAVRAELGYWLHTLSPQEADEPADDLLEREPYTMLRVGRWREAHQIWQAAGFRYEAAVALSRSDEVDDELRSLADLDDLGAEPMARAVRASLRLRGIAGVPRGPQPSTKDHPLGLTARQSEVARLVAQGMTNAEIAAHLVVSVRTVDSHVAAVLAKAGVANRRGLVARFVELGMTLDGDAAG
ncbi:MAG: LuxR C-terminal-related transcriptional regulator [Nocardioides sp.]